MNGRVYDPKLGRFMSADPHIQAPTDTQSLNRYSYVLNNPMSATDPSGYFSLRKWVGTIVAIAGTIACGGNVQCGHAAYVAIGAASGAAGAAANGGNILKGALIGAFTGEMFYRIGQYANTGAAGSPVGKQTWQVGENAFVSGAKYAKVVGLHAAAGGVASVLNGGKFGHGFVSAGFGKSFSHMIAGIGNEGGQLVATMVVAGTASKLVGGKFANGANTAAFQYLANWDSSDDDPDPDPDADAEIGFEGRLKFADLLELTAKGALGDDGVNIKAALTQGEGLKVKFDSDGVAKITIMNGNSGGTYTTDVDLGPAYNKKIFGLTFRVFAAENGRLGIQFGGNLYSGKYGVLEGYTYGSINVDGAVLNNSGLLGQAARGLRNRTKQLDKACKEQGC